MNRGGHGAMVTVAIAKGLPVSSFCAVTRTTPKARP
jgi:hypothetical protein